MKTISIPVKVKAMRTEDIDFRLIAYKLLNNEEVCLPLEDGTYLSINCTHAKCGSTTYDLTHHKTRKITFCSTINEIRGVVGDISELKLIIQRLIGNKRVLINNDILFNEYLEAEGKKDISFKHFKEKCILSPAEAKKIIKYVNNHLDQNNNYIGSEKVPKEIQVEGNFNLYDIVCNIKVLPKKLIIIGNFKLDATSIEILPEYLEVKGVLYLENLNKNFGPHKYSKIKKYPKTLIVEKNVVWIGRKELTELPSVLKVGGSINLSYANFNKMPNIFIAGGFVNLSGSNIKTLSDNFIANELKLYESNITKLPNNLVIEGNLDISKCPNLKELPKNLTVKGDLLCEYSEIKNLPNDISINGNIYLSFSKIKKLPNNLTVYGDLILSNSAIEELPKNLVINGNLNIENTKIEEIPDDLKLNGKLYAGKSSLKKIPNNFVVHEHLDLSYSKIMSLPKDLQVVDGKVINLSNTDITMLPKKFLNNAFNCYLNLSNTKIKVLPTNLVVKSLNLQNATITELPTNLKVKNFVAISGSNIKNIPADLKTDKVFYGPKQLELDKISKSLKEKISFIKRKVYK